MHGGDENPNSNDSSMNIRLNGERRDHDEEGRETSSSSNPDQYQLQNGDVHHSKNNNSNNNNSNSSSNTEKDVKKGVTAGDQGTLLSSAKSPFQSQQQYDDSTSSSGASSSASSQSSGARAVAGTQTSGKMNGKMNGQQSQLDQNNNKPHDNSPVKVCVIGYGLLGARIAVELAMCGAQVSVFDKNATEAIVEEKARKLLKECFQLGLFPSSPSEDSSSSSASASSSSSLALASSSAAESASSASASSASASSASASSASSAELNTTYRETVAKVLKNLNLCKTISDAVSDVELVSEAIPDRLDAKRSVFAEIEKYSKNPNAVFTTNTLTVPLGDIARSLQHPQRLVGLRFLYPVAFIPFVEVCVAPNGGNSEFADLLLNTLNRLGKIAFHFYLTEPGPNTTTAGDGGRNSDSSRQPRLPSDEEMARNYMPGEYNEMRYATTFQEALEARETNGYARFRLMPSEYMSHQKHEARRRFHHVEDGPEEVVCCVCLQEKPSTVIASCGHKVLCLACAKLLLRQGTAACPLCRHKIRGLKRLVT